MNRGKPGIKHHVVVDRRGTPLAARITGANRHDSKVFEEMIDAIRPIQRPRGRPRKRPVCIVAAQDIDCPDVTYSVDPASASRRRSSSANAAVCSDGR